MSRSCVAIDGTDMLTNSFEADFTKERLGRPHHMKFTAKPTAQVAFVDHAK
jgi:hypothetical protein